VFAETLQWPELVCWTREWLTNALLEKDRLEFIWNQVVHHRMILEPFQVRLQTLQRLAPSHITHLARWNAPAIEATKPLHQSLSIARCDAVDKAVPQACLSQEINGQVQKVVSAFESLCIQQLHQRITGIVVWDVPQHE